MSILSTNHVGRAVVLITFDDGRVSQYTTAFPIMEQYHLRGNAYVIPGFIGDAGYLSTEQTKTLYDAGWAIGNHTMNHVNLVTQSEAQQEIALSEAHDWLVANDMPRAAHHVAYPYGGHNADTATAMSALGMLTGRTTNAGLQPSPPDNPLELSVRYISVDSTRASIHSYIDAVVAASSGLILIFHGIVENPVTDDVTPATFADTCAYLRESDLEVLTITEWYENLSGAVTIADDLTKGSGYVNQSGFYIPTKYGTTWTKGPFTYLT